MNFTAGLLALLATAQSIIAFPYKFAQSGDLVDPVPVTKLVCDGNSFQCTANLDFGDGNWIAQWNSAVFHNGMFGSPDFKETYTKMTMAPVEVTELNCDGDNFKCTGNLDFGDGNWVAQWSANVFHQSLKRRTSLENRFSPVPVTKMTCDGDSNKCNANLDFGDGDWVAQWGVTVSHDSYNARPHFLKQ